MLLPLQFKDAAALMNVYETPNIFMCSYIFLLYNKPSLMYNPADNLAPGEAVGVMGLNLAQTAASSEKEPVMYAGGETIHSH